MGYSNTRRGIGVLLRIVQGFSSIRACWTGVLMQKRETRSGQSTDPSHMFEVHDIPRVFSFPRSLSLFFFPPSAPLPDGLDLRRCRRCWLPSLSLSLLCCCWESASSDGCSAQPNTRSKDATPGFDVFSRCRGALAQKRVDSSSSSLL